jgi:hypothetical protein
MLLLLYLIHLHWDALRGLALQGCTGTLLRVQLSHRRLILGGLKSIGSYHRMQLGRRVI